MPSPSSCRSPRNQDRDQLPGCLRQHVILARMIGRLRDQDVSITGEERPWPSSATLRTTRRRRRFARFLKGSRGKATRFPTCCGRWRIAPGCSKGSSRLNSALPRTELDGKLRELAYIKTSELNGCDYCLHHHRTTGKKVGLSERQLNETAQVETSDAYDELQRDVLRYAEEVTRHINVNGALLRATSRVAFGPRDRGACHDRRHRQLHQPRDRDAEAGAPLTGRVPESRIWPVIASAHLPCLGSNMSAPVTERAWVPLTPRERRILGVMVEKAKTTLSITRSRSRPSSPAAIRNPIVTR